MPATSPTSICEDGVGLLGRAGLGGDPHLQALDAAGQEGDGGVAGRVELVEAVGEHLGEPRLRAGPRCAGCGCG